MTISPLSVFRSILLHTCVFATGGCVAQTFVDYDTKADFNHYRSYAWIAPGDSVLNRDRRDKLFGGTIMHFANQELKKRGMAIDTLRPEVLFMFGTSLSGHVEYEQGATLSVGVGVAGPGYYVGGSAPVAGGKITERSVNDGTLTFDMYDMRSGKWLWRGGTRKSFRNEDDVSKLIAEATKKIFRKFPKKGK